MKEKFVVLPFPAELPVGALAELIKTTSPRRMRGLVVAKFGVNCSSANQNGTSVPLISASSETRVLSEETSRLHWY